MKTIFRSRSNNLTSQIRIAPALMLPFICLFLLSSCQGYTPPVPATPTSEPRPILTPIPPRQVTQIPLMPSLTPTSSLPATSQLEVDAQDLKGVTVQFWRVSGEPDTLKTLIDEFNRSNAWGIRVVTESYTDYGAIFDNIQTYIYGDLPDLVMGHDYQIFSLAGAGDRVTDLSAYVYDPIWGYAPEELADFYPVFWSGVQDEKIFSVPLYRSAQVLLYNQTWASELGFTEPPANPPNFRAQACAAAQANRSDSDPGNHGTGGWLIDFDTPSMAAWLMAYGVDFVPLGERGYSFINAQNEKALQFLRGLQDENCAYRLDGADNHTEFARQQALFVSSSLSGILAQEKAQLNAASTDRWTVLPYPSSSGKPVIYTFGPSLAILSSNPEQQLAAWLLARWLMEAENQARLAEAQGTFPVRISTRELLDTYRTRHPAWEAALDLLPYARREPGRASWEVVRWVLSDAGGQLFSPTFTKERIPELIKMLQDTAIELDNQYR